MLVYGDAQLEYTAAVLLETLAARLARYDSWDTLPQSNALRTLLTWFGQAEQAFHDAADADDAAAEPPLKTTLSSIASVIEDATSKLAAAFIAFQHKRTPSRTAFTTTAFVQARNALADAQALAASIHDHTLTVKTPEGFAFYALYPEAYQLSAQSWLDDHPNENAPVIVIGVRSIGTTLSAVVMATLQKAGRTARRFTVRPTGHPFERHVLLSSSPDPAAWYLVVDEGPGFSGSSMAAVAQALAEGSVDPVRISFLPGHRSLPGGKGARWITDWWEHAPRYPAHNADVGLEGLSVVEALAHLTFKQLGSKVVQMDDLGGGLWRKFTFGANDERYPAVALPFDRPKYLATLKDGRRVLWKFGGFTLAPEGSGTGAERMESQLFAHQKAAAMPSRVFSAHGFVAREWIEGTPLRQGDATSDILRHIGRYIARVAGAPLGEASALRALDRLRELLYWNTWELLGEDAAAKAQSLVPFFSYIPATTYGDGRLAPHDWLRAPDSSLVKPDSSTRDHDHTLIGSQSVLWDVAGAWIEWGLNDAQGRILMSAFTEDSQIHVNSDALFFYRTAYAAFRAGQCAMCAASADPVERERLNQAAAGYTEQLQALLM